jgi:hypothetical protein
MQEFSRAALLAPLAVSLLITRQLQAQMPAPTATPVATPVAATAPSAIKIGDYTVTGSLRVRPEYWDWFRTPGFDDSYLYGGALLRVGMGRSRSKLDEQYELAVPFLAGLPDNAIAPAPQGALGLGANYRAANGNGDGSIFPKQLFLRFKQLGSPANSLRVGRFEYIDGSEVTPKNATLAALKRDRINHRLIGNFGFSHVGRSFDGLQFVNNTPRGNFNLMAMRPTEGVFQLNGLGEVKDVDVVLGSYTKPMRNAEARLMGIYYRDGRQAPLSVKVDNRPGPVRTADREEIAISTLAGHYITALPAGSGTVDLLAWGALQTGSWGTLDHKATAVALEGGYQFANMKLKPWLRAGYYRGSGDGNPVDGEHETFFSILPTPRIYARTPFYNAMNNEDLFASLILRPSPKLNVRADVHRLNLSSAGDLWYAGGGAFQDNSFGYAGRPSGGSKSLATLYDISFDYNLSPQTAIGLYLGHAAGGSVIRNIYPNGQKLNFAFVEVTQKF